MQILVNKSLNRIHRRKAKQVNDQHSFVEPYSTISTFRTINPQQNNILQVENIRDKIPFKIDGFLSFCRHIKKKKNPFEELSRPKAVSCQKISKHNSFNLTVIKQKKHQNDKKQRQLNYLNKTISFSFNQTVKTTRHSIPKIFTGQDELDLKNQQFKRRHKSLKNYQTLSGEQITGIEKNTIMSNTLSKFSIAQIYEMKKMQDQKKKLIHQMFRTGQLISNQPGQSEQLRQLSNLKDKFDSKPSQKLQEAQKINDVFDKKTVQKYQKLVDQIRTSQKYFIDTYDDYDKMLTQRNPLYKRRRHNKNKILANYAEQWR